MIKKLKYTVGVFISTRYNQVPIKLTVNSDAMDRPKIYVHIKFNIACATR